MPAGDVDGDDPATVAATGALATGSARTGQVIDAAGDRGGDPALEIRVLGPVEARHHGTAVPISSPSQRIILAALARDPGKPVSRDRLVSLVWDDDPPPSAAASLKR